jgi:GxxExxY protein
VYYKDIVFADYFADLIFNDTIILELKAKDTLTKDHNNQLINYLKATGYEVGLLLNKKSA